MMMMMHTHKKIITATSKFKQSILGCTLWLIYCVRTLHTKWTFKKTSIDLLNVHKLA